MARKFIATVKEYGGGHPWIVIEPNEDNGVRHGSAIVIDLPAGSKLDQARELAAALNHGAESIAVKTW
jgi:hypothetical protein